MVRLSLLIPTLDQSGAEKQLTLLATRLPRDEFDVEVLTLDRGGPFEAALREAGIPVTVLGKRFKFDPAALWRLRRHLRQRRPDILHAWLFSANSYGRLVGRGAARRIVVSERCVDSWKQGWQLWLDRRLMSRTAALVANSQSVADFYTQLGFPREQVHVIANGVEPAPRQTLDRDEFLAAWDIPRDAKLICYAGRLAPQKRVDDLLWAAQVLRQAEPRTCLLVIGDGPQREKLQQHARDVECIQHVRFLGHRGDAAQVMSLCDVFWLGSSFEGMSNSLLEAMGSGLPVVVSDIPPNREVVTHGVEGYRVAVGDGAGFAQYTLRLFEQPELARALGNAGREKMLTLYAVERMVEQHVALYRGVVGSG